MIAAVLLLFQDPDFYVRAESLLAEHDLPQARAVAERLVSRHPGDARAHLLLGRIWLDWPTFGRFQALDEFREAARLAPHDPEPLYLESTVGFVLHQEDGETLARDALIKLFAVAPDYRDTWERFKQVHQSPAIWRKADAALSHFPDDPAALAHRAELALRLDQAGRADSLATRALDRRPHDEALLLLRAEANFATMRDSAGYAWYDSALARENDDSAQVMWNAVWMIATPGEDARYAGTRPTGRRAFFEAFWGPRDPDLVTPENERIAEHFRRLLYVQQNFPLQFPMNSFFYSAGRRALATTWTRGYLKAMASHGCVSGVDTLSGIGFLPEGSQDAALAAAGLGPDASDVDSTAGAKVMRRAGFDARGLVWIRYGKPDVRTANTPDPARPCDNGIPGSSAIDVEGWLYYTAAGPRTIGFVRGTGLHLTPTDPAGDFLFMPITRRQVESGRVLLRTERTSVPAPLNAHLWSAVFRGAGSLKGVDVYFRAVPETAAVALWDSLGTVTALARGPGLLALHVNPGRYDLGADVDSSGVLGRLRQSFTVPFIADSALRLSSLVLAADTTITGRLPILSALPADLTYPAGHPVLAYAELYGLASDADGHSHYRVRYTFAPSRGLVARLLSPRDRIVLEYTREAPSRRIMPEQVAIDPQSLPPGRYQVTLEVSDLVAVGRTQSVSLEITIR